MKTLALSTQSLSCTRVAIPVSVSSRRQGVAASIAPRTATCVNQWMSQRRGSWILRATRDAGGVQQGSKCIESEGDLMESADTEICKPVNSASEVVRAYYDAVNRRDLEGAMQFLSSDVVYEDLALFPRAMQGRERMREFLGKWMNFPEDVKFVVDEMVEGDALATGVTWHLEVAGRAMPFSRGASFYRVDAQGLLVYGRDQVEPVTKSGEGGVQVLKSIFPLIRKMSPDQAAGFVQPLPQACPAADECTPSARVAMSFYQSVNQRDMHAAVADMTVDVAYEDLQMFAEAKVGKDTVFRMLEAYQGLDPDVLFVIDDVTAASAGGVATVWHLEVGGIPMPFSRGVSFYRLNDQGEMQFGRDLVEPPLKPGNFGMTIMGAMFPLIRALPSTALQSTPVLDDRASSTSLQNLGSGRTSQTPDAMAFQYKSEGVVSKTAPESVVLWVAYALYWGVVLLGTDVPGNPIQDTQWEVIEELIGESLNFFYVNPLMHTLGVTFIPSPANHPVNEALFNFVNAWSLMFAPLVISDARAKAAGVDRTKWWFGQFFLTNIFFIPFMALRSQAPKQAFPRMSESAEGDSTVSLVRQLVGITGLSIAVISTAWACAARPEFGDAAQRIQHFQTMMHTDRVYFAFVLDMVIYSVFQAKLMGESIPENAPLRWLRLIPFFGLAGYLLTDEDASPS